MARFRGSKKNYEIANIQRAEICKYLSLSIFAQVLLYPPRATIDSSRESAVANVFEAIF